MMDKGIWKILAISVILAIVASSMAIYSTVNLEKGIDKKGIDEGGGKGVISLVASSFIGVAGASPAGGGSGSGGGAALEAGMTFLEEEVGISAYANVGAEGMLTYTNEEYGFSIEYPEDWKVLEDFMVVWWCS